MRVARFTTHAMPSRARNARGVCSAAAARWQALMLRRQCGRIVRVSGNSEPAYAAKPPRSAWHSRAGVYVVGEGMVYVAAFCFWRARARHTVARDVARQATEKIEGRAYGARDTRRCDALRASAPASARCRCASAARALRGTAAPPPPPAASPARKAPMQRLSRAASPSRACRTTRCRMVVAHVTRYASACAHAAAGKSA